MKTLTILFVVAAVAAVIGAVVVYTVWTRASHVIKGNGVSKSEARPVSDFRKIVVSGGYNIQWSHGKPALNITTDENLLPYIRTQVSGDTLQIETKENLRSTKTTQITISSESLADVQLTGAVSLNAGALSGPNLKVGATGASTINVDGSVADLVANLTGASTLHASSLLTQTTSLTLTGASRADVAVAETLKASITGAGFVEYSGNPKAVEQSVTGAGSIRRRQ